MITRPDDDGFTDPSDSPDARIDFVYLVPGSGVAVAFTTCELVLSEPVGGLYASDHIGVMCDVELR